MNNLMWHHALFFLQEYVDLGAEALANHLGYDETHSQQLFKFLSIFFNENFDTPLEFNAKKHDGFCLDCPRRSGPIIWAYGGKNIQLEKCNIRGGSIKKAENFGRERISSLTGKNNPTLREIYDASRREMK